MYERAITTLQRAEEVPGVSRGTVRFNIGNNYLHLGDAERAHAAFTAAIEEDPVATDAYLNRANVNVSLGRYEEAVSDYNSVLGLEPGHPQRERIEQMIALLQGHIAEAKRKAEEEERRREEAEARRRALLDNVLDSIKTSAEETENMSAGNEEIDTYEDDDLDIAD
jgi:tetratricopeptide (TPR) repeat protein